MTARCAGCGGSLLQPVDGERATEDAAVRVLIALLRLTGPMALDEVGTRLAGALGNEGDARSTMTNALYMGRVRLSADRTVSLPSALGDAA